VLEDMSKAPAGSMTRTMRSILNDHSVRQVNNHSFFKTLILKDYPAGSI